MEIIGRRIEAGQQSTGNSLGNEYRAVLAREASLSEAVAVLQRNEREFDEKDGSTGTTSGRQKSIELPLELGGRGAGQQIVAADEDQHDVGVGRNSSGLNEGVRNRGAGPRQVVHAVAAGWLCS